MLQLKAVQYGLCRQKTVHAWGSFLGCVLLSLFICCGMTGCVRVPIVFKASSTLNPDIHQVPSPLWIQVMTLSRIEYFNKASFSELSEINGAIPDEGVIRVERLFVLPGEEKTIQVSWDKNARGVGIVAAYQALDHAHWKSFVPCASEVPIPGAESSESQKDQHCSFVVTLGENEVSAAVKHP